MNRIWKLRRGEVDRASSGIAPRVIVTEDAPSYGALAAVRGLRASGYDPWVAVTRGRTYASRSRACGGTLTVPDPGLRPEAFAAGLARAADKVHAVAVLPGTERAIVALAGRNECFSPLVTLGVCEREAVRCATSKVELARLGTEAGLRSPPFVEIQQGAPADLSQITYPAIVKTPQKLTASRDGRLQANAVTRVDGPEELRQLLSSSAEKRFLVQPYISANLEAICGVAWQGEVVCASHQVADRIYPPSVGISAYARTVKPNIEIEQRVRRLVELIGWSGTFEVQLLRSGGRRYLIDFNPHFYGSLALAIASGLNLPTIWLEHLLGSGCHPGTYRTGVRYRSEERDAGALFSASLDGDWRTVASGLLPRRGTVHAVFSLRDPMPSVNSLRHLRKLPHRMVETTRSARAGNETHPRRP